MKRVLLFLISFSFISCSSRSTLNVSTRVRHSLMQGPETNGQSFIGSRQAGLSRAQASFFANGGTSVSLGRSSQTRESFLDDPGSVDIETDTSLTRRVSNSMDLNLGLLKRLDLLGNVSFRGKPAFGLKAQLLGAPSREERGLKLSLMMLHGFGRGEAKNKVVSNILYVPFIDEDNDEFDNVSAVLSKRHYHYSGVLGYRLKKDLLYYMSLYYANYEIEGTLNVADQRFFVLDRVGEVFSTHLGASFNNHEGNIFLKTELGYARTRFSVISKGGFSAGIGMGVEF